VHDINTPFLKGVDGNNGVQRSRVGACLLVEYFPGWAFFDGLDAIFENQGPKVAGM
jgi:hypothetical protein